MRTYCKAYALREVAAFAGWVGRVRGSDGGELPAGSRGEAPGGSRDVYVYVHDDFVVTEGIARGEDVVFDRVTPEWIEHCRAVLGFSVQAW